MKKPRTCLLKPSTTGILLRKSNIKRSKIDLKSMFFFPTGCVTKA